MDAVYLYSSADLQNNGKGKTEDSVLYSSSSSHSRFYGGSTNGEFYLSSYSLISYSSPSVYYSSRSHQQNQPPLLPLPISKPNYQNNNRRVNSSNNQRSLIVRKSNFIVANSRREKSKYGYPKLNSSDSVVNQIGAEQKDDAPTFLLSHNVESNDDNQVKFSGSVVSSILSPSPSSLPLPTFSLRPKLSCKAAARRI